MSYKIRPYDPRHFLLRDSSVQFGRARSGRPAYLSRVVKGIASEEQLLSRWRLAVGWIKDVSDLVQSIRSLGIIQPLPVQPNRKDFEIVARQRR